MKFTKALILTLLLAPVAGLACRCAERDLAEYFAQADVVIMGRLVASDTDADKRVLQFEQVAPPYKGSPGALDNIVTYTTAVSTATCGIQPVTGALYILFASTTGQPGSRLAVDSCSGSRLHIPADGGEPQGFVDVPARFVAQQLNGLAGMQVLAAVSANAPDPTSIDNEALIGLLDLAALAHGDTIPILSAPLDSAATIAVIRGYADIESREVGYGQPAAVVFARREGWSKVRMLGGEFGWISAADAGTWFDYAELPVRRLAYLNQNWSGFVWPSAGAGLPWRSVQAHRSDRREFAVNVLESTTIGGMPWFRVEVLDGDVCSGTEPGVALAGWVPAYGADGTETTWFWSRGC